MDVVKKSVDFFLISSFRLGLTGTCALKFLKNFHVTKTETLFFIFFFLFLFLFFFSDWSVKKNFCGRGFPNHRLQLSYSTIEQ